MNLRAVLVHLFLGLSLTACAVSSEEVGTDLGNSEAKIGGGVGPVDFAKIYTTNGHGDPGDSGYSYDVPSLATDLFSTPSNFTNPPKPELRACVRAIQFIAEGETFEKPGEKSQIIKFTPPIEHRLSAANQILSEFDASLLVPGIRFVTGAVYYATHMRLHAETLEEFTGNTNNICYQGQTINYTEYYFNEDGQIRKDQHFSYSRLRQLVRMDPWTVPIQPVLAVNLDLTALNRAVFTNSMEEDNWIEQVVLSTPADLNIRSR